jgi:predicted RNase H-like HicB family nuclease
MKPTDYPVFLVYSKEDRAWLARVDWLPGCVADGKTQEEALANVRVAIEDWISVSKELGREIPKALDIQDLEDIQLQAMKAQQQQIQKLIQQAVTQVIQQAQAVPLKPVVGQRKNVGRRGYQVPTPQVTGFTATV